MVTCQPNQPGRRGVSPAVRNLLIACAAACAALSPALAYSDGPADGSFRAVGTEWLANGGPGNELTIAPGQTVTFVNPAGGIFHNAVFTDTPSACQGDPAGRTRRRAGRAAAASTTPGPTGSRATSTPG